MKHWLYDTLDAKWHWYRYEYQGRGSIHCHGTAKLNNDPGLCQLTEKPLKGFLAQKFKDKNDCPDTTEVDQDIEAGKKAAETACQYVDWLMSTVNPVPPHEDMWIRPPVHPCQKHHGDIKVPIMPGQLLFFLKVRRLKLIFSKEKIRFEFFSRLYRPSNPPVNPENPQQQGDWVRVMF